MKELPFVSVIVPTYNRASLLKRLLESLREQTYPADKFEVLIVDDGSTDETPQVVEEFARSAPFAVRYFRQPRKGPAAARNLGIQYSKGEIIAFADHDVTVIKEWIARAIRYFKELKVDGVEGRTEPHGEDTPFSHRNYNLNGGLYLTCNMFYTKTILQKVGGFDERFFPPPYREDTDLAWRVLDAGGRIVFAPDVVAFHPYFPKRPLEALKSYAVFQYDYLLYFKHPKRFRDAGWFPKLHHHLFHCTLGVITLAALVAKSYPIAAVSGILLLIRTFRSTKRTLNGYRADAFYIAEAFLYCLLAPFVHLWWRLYGYLRFLPYHPALRRRSQ
jgi:glycosyltransferase involved in cell wall biosynthesis